MRKIIAAILSFATLLLTANPIVFAADDADNMVTEAGVGVTGEGIDTPTGQDVLKAMEGATNTAPIVPASTTDPATTTAADMQAATTTETADGGQKTVSATSSDAISAIDAAPDEGASATVTGKDMDTVLATSTEEIETGVSSTTSIPAVVATPDVATTTTTTPATTSDNAATGKILLTPEFSVLALWEMIEDGRDDDSAGLAQFMPSGQYQITKKIQICGVMVGDQTQMEGIYGQVFYPDSRVTDGGVPSSGQVIGPICKMQKIDIEKSFDLLCEKIQKENASLPTFASGFNFTNLCGENGKIKNETASIYCCDQTLAYDDVPGNYHAAVIIKDVNNNYSEILENEFSYLPLARINIDFNNIYYGKVEENVETVAESRITNAIARNVGNVSARLSLWQDDMGLGKTGDIYNIRYGSRISNIGASWTYYAPFETILMPDVLKPGETVDLDFSVEVLNFPLAMDGDNVNYRGKMKIEAVAANISQFKSMFGEQAALESTNEVIPENNEIIAKPETVSDQEKQSLPIL